MTLTFRKYAYPQGTNAEASDADDEQTGGVSCCQRALRTLSHSYVKTSLVGAAYMTDEMLAHGSDQRLSRTAVEGGVVESPRSRRRSALRERQTLSWKQPWAARFARILEINIAMWTVARAALQKLSPP